MPVLMTPAQVRWSCAGAVALLLVVLPLYAWRLSLGVDLSDESGLEKGPDLISPA